MHEQISQISEKGKGIVMGGSIVAHQVKPPPGFGTPPIYVLAAPFQPSSLTHEGDLDKTSGSWLCHDPATVST